MIFEKPPVLPEDLAKLDENEVNILCGKIRTRLVETVAKNGGHLASNLGVVELTVALYSVFDPYRDRIIWDVGHQAYVHKILTGREAAMDGLRRPEGISGFPKRSESRADAFNTGHSSTSVSAALGFARGFQAAGDDRRAIAVIGDGALTGGMAYEALNDVAQSRCNVIVVLNDNGMSIDRNVGGLSRYLGKIRKKHSYLRTKQRVRGFLLKIPKAGPFTARQIVRVKNGLKRLVFKRGFFEDLGMEYLGPVDGHDSYALRMTLERAKETQGPVLVHVQTKKGKGYGPAEDNPGLFHGLGGFDPETGAIKTGSAKSLSKVFSDTLKEAVEEDRKIVAVTAAMSLGTGLDEIADAFPDNLIDVGIAEPHAVTMSAGLSLAGQKPVTVIYSTFLQRAYDQLLHDVTLQKVPLVLGIDRAGVCGYDGETHHGIYDFSYLSSLPGAVISAPGSAEDLSSLLRLALHVYDAEEQWIPNERKSLFAIRYPAKERFTFSEDPSYIRRPVVFGRGSVCFDGRRENGPFDGLIVSIGEMLEEAFAAAEMLEKRGKTVVVFDARFLRPLDESAILELACDAKKIVTAEDAIAAGGLGESVALLLTKAGISRPLEILAHPNTVIENDSVNNQLKKSGLTRERIAEII